MKASPPTACARRRWVLPLLIGGCCTLLPGARFGAASAPPPGDRTHLQAALVEVVVEEHRFAPRAEEMPRVGAAAERGTDHPDDVIAALLPGRLVTLRAANATIELVINALAEGLRIPVLAFTDRDGGIDGGLSWDRTIDIDVMRRPATELLDLVAEAFDDFDATWQIVEGRIEIGPRFVLARPSVRRTRIFPVDHLMMDIPNNPLIRKTPERIAVDLVEMILRDLEPEAWEHHPKVRWHLEETGEIENLIARVGRYASITYQDGRFHLTAPPYLHRQFAGPHTGGNSLALPPPADRMIRRTDADLRAPARLARAELRTFVPSGRRPRDPVPRDIDQRTAWRMLGRLMHARLDLHFEEAPLREAIDALLSATGADVRVFYDSGRSALSGLDPDHPVHLRLQGVDGLSALQLLMDLAALDADATWQFNGATIEAGPRRILARTSARRLEIHDINDLQMDIPRFALANSGRTEDYITPLERRYGRALGVERSREGHRRKSRAFRAAEFLLLTLRHVEPEAWVRDPEDRLLRYRPGQGDHNPLQLRGNWAIARATGGTLTINAPDFIHRQISGLPNPPSPADR